MRLNPIPQFLRWLSVIVEYGGRLFSRLLLALFSPSTAPTWTHRLVMIVLCFAGILHWQMFFNRGPLAFDFEDWPKERCYLHILREAVSTGTVPLHMDASLQTTQRFLALPETMLAPHVVLLRWMTDQQFVAFHVSLMCLIGIAGCSALSRRFGWSPFAFLFFSTVFSFNGFIVCRMGVGHFMWAGYYLFPWVLLATLRMFDGKENPARWLEVAGVFFALFLVGSFHLAIWWMLFLGICSLIRPSMLPATIAIFVAIALLGLFRIGPAAITFGHVHREFASGYPDLAYLWRAFAVPLTYDAPYLQVPTASLGWWEFDHFVGIPVFIAVLWFSSRAAFTPDGADKSAYRILFIAALVLAVLAMSQFYAPIANAPIPLFNAERVTTRFISVSFLVLLFCAVQWLNKRAAGYSQLWQFVACVVLVQTIFELQAHSALWSPAILESTHGPSPYWENSATMDAHIVTFGMEMKYKLVVAASWAISGLAAITCAIVWWRLQRAEAKKTISTEIQ
jgi:hypothetical protein